MCNIIVYGFTSDGIQMSGSCTTTTASTLGAYISLQTENTDIGKTIVARVNVRKEPNNIGEFNSSEYTVIYAGLLTLYIPFTDITISPGTYTLGYGATGCGYIYDTTNLGSYICYSCDTTRCTSAIVTLPCTNPTCEFSLT